MTVGKHWDHPLTFVLTDEAEVFEDSRGLCFESEASQSFILSNPWWGASKSTLSLSSFHYEL